VSVFSNTQIRKAIEEGHIVCTPFNPKHIAHASLDVTLGYYYYRTGQAQRATQRLVRGKRRKAARKYSC
jgi:deoxycytidine triphosphate deaminase